MCFVTQQNRRPVSHPLTREERVPLTPQLQELVRALVARFESTHKAAANFATVARQQGSMGGVELAVSQPTLARVCRGATDALQWTTWVALAWHGRRFGIGSEKAWVESVYTRRGRIAFALYYRRLDRELTRMDPQRGQLPKMLERIREWGLRPEVRRRQEQRLRLTRHLTWRELMRVLVKERRQGRKVGPLYQQGSAATAVERFVEWYNRRHWASRAGTKQRLTFALTRALEPLLDAGRFGGFEMGAEELEEKGKLGRFVRAALERERVLLDRQPDERRAQWLARGV